MIAADSQASILQMIAEHEDSLHTLQYCMQKVVQEDIVAQLLKKEPAD